MAHRIVFQIVAISSRVLGRAVTEAWRQASATKKYTSSTPGASSSSSSSSSPSALSISTGNISLSEACQILNVKPPARPSATGAGAAEVDMGPVMERFKQLFDANEVERGGSFYLQSKVLRARERIEREVEGWREEAERRAVSEGWKPRVFRE